MRRDARRPGPGGSERRHDVVCSSSRDASTRAPPDSAAYGNTPRIALLSEAMAGLAESLQLSGRLSEAAALAERSAEAALRTLGPEHPITREAITTAIECYEAWHTAEPSAGHAESAETWRQH